MAVSDGQKTEIWTRNGFVSDSLVAERGAVEMGVEEITGRLAPGGTNVLRMEAGDEVGAAAGRISEFAAVKIIFPAFSDGRGFSTARLLREKLGFKGIIRAEGHFILDQIPLMLRVGFDQFAVSHAPTLDRLARGELPGIALYLQPAMGDETRAGGRAWTRRSAAS